MRRISRTKGCDSCYFGRYSLPKLADCACNIFGGFDRQVVPRVSQLHEKRSGDRAGAVEPDALRQSKGVLGACDYQGRCLNFGEPVHEIDAAAAIVPSDPVLVLRDQRIIDDSRHAFGRRFLRHRGTLKAFDSLARAVGCKRHRSMLFGKPRRFRRARCDEDKPLQICGAFCRDVLRKLRAHGMRNQRNRSIEGRKCGAKIACVPFEIVTFRWTIRKTAAPKIKQPHRAFAWVQAICDVIPHASRRNPSVRKENRATSVASRFDA